MSERLYNLQQLLYPDTPPCATSKQDNLYLLYSYKRGSSKSTRRAIIEALGGLGPEEDVVAALIQSLQDHSLRYTAVEALGKMGSGADEAVPALIQALEHEEIRSVQAAIVRSLGEMGPGATEAIPILIGILENGTDQPTMILCFSQS